MNGVGTQDHNDFAARWLAYMLPCRRFADVLADGCARLGADVGRYSFIAVDFHPILLAGLPAHSLALRPAHSRRHQYVTCYTEGFSHFVTSMTAPVASGWSGCRVGLAPTGKRRLVTAHTSSGHSKNGTLKKKDRHAAVFPNLNSRWKTRLPTRDNAVAGPHGLVMI